MPMRCFGILAFAFLASCSGGEQDLRRHADAQAKSQLGPTASWMLDKAVSRSEIQGMRDRAYSFCADKKPPNPNCFDEQDHSLFEYARSFDTIRLFRAEQNPTFPFALGHKLDPNAFKRVHDYCRTVYTDHGSDDARMLGPCMIAGTGGDYFGVVQVR